MQRDTKQSRLVTIVIAYNRLGHALCKWKNLITPYNFESPPAMINPLSSIKKRIKMRYLRLLLIFSEEGSLKKTAEKMLITQSAATKTLKELETLVGKPLFARAPNGLIANELGKAAIRYAQLVFADLDSLHEEITALDAGHLGTVRIGAMTSLESTLLPKAIARIKKDHPKLNILVTFTTSDLLIQALNRGHLDLLVTRVPHGCEHEGLEFELFGEEHIQIVVGSHHPKCTKKSITLKDLAAYPWIVHPQATPLREVFHQLFSEAKLNTPLNLVETSSITFSASLLEQTEMVAIMSKSYTEYYCKLGIIKPLPINLPSSLPNYGLIYRKNRPVTPAMALVSSIIRDEVIGRADFHL